MKFQGRAFKVSFKFKNQRKRKRFLRGLAIFGGISGALALTWVGSRWSHHGPEVKVLPAPVSGVSSADLPAPPSHKPRAKPHSPLRETAKERERIGHRLHEF